jgi:flagellar biosynthesis protein FlhB
MAEEHDNDNTFLPTQRKRDKAREDGVFAYSLELNNSLMLFAGAFCLWWGGLSLAHGLHYELLAHVSRLRVELSVDEAHNLITDLSWRGMQLTSVIVGGLFLVGLAANLGQAGFHLNTSSLGPKWERLNPAENWKRIASKEGLMRGGYSIAKLLLIVAVLWWTLSDQFELMATLAEQDLRTIVQIVWAMGAELLINSAAVLLVIGAGDYGFQWFRHEKSLMMSREEFKREVKDDEGDPLLNAHRKQRARELAMQTRMLEEVPKADLVVSNPTHYAVALRFKRGQMAAPVVVAKGRDDFALRIMQKARRHGIPVVERKPLARALFKMVQVGHEIPQSLFYAVSEVINFLHQLQNPRGST